MAVPDFLIIGAARAGSTYLARNLATHPDVFIPNQKELHFFDWNYNEGWDHYQQFFDTAAPDHQAVGEATPTYMCSETVAQRIHTHLPDAKLIAILRDPVDRAYSHYWNAVAEKMGTSASYAEKKQEYPFEEALESRPRLIEDGLYEQNLRPFFERFGKEQISVLLFEEVVEHPDPYFQKVFRFLEVDDTFQSPLVDRRINSSSQKHGWSRLLLRLYNFTTAYVHIPFVARWIETANESAYPPMRQEVRNRLENRFERSNRRLEELLGRSLEAWRS